MSDISCSECGKKFSLKSNLTRHLRGVHNFEVLRCDVLPAHFDVYHYKCLEEGCKISFKYNRDLRAHLRSNHDFDLGEINLEFPNAEEFRRWRYKEETNNCVQFVHSTAPKKTTMGKETFYYECNRTGKRQVLDDSVRKRKARKNMQKLDRGCTSQMIATKCTNGVYNVIYFKTHYGHDLEPEHISMSKDDRAAIASRLLLGVPVSSVLNSVQETKGNCPLKRINLLKRKDIVNIWNSVSSTKDGKTTNFEMNINDFIFECSKYEFNPVLYYNVLNASSLDDVCLVIMSQSQAEILHELANNNIIVVSSSFINNSDFELVTLFILYGEGESFPGACMFTNKRNFEMYELFFHKIKSVVGQIAPSVFVSKVGKMYNEAWKKVMGTVDHNFYSSMNIDLDWKVNLNKISSKEKRKLVYDKLTNLKQILDENHFNKEFEEDLRIFKKDDHLRDFFRYFLNNYADPRKWADCFKSTCKLNLHYDSADDILRRYIDGIDRFDKVFHALIRYLRDQTVNVLVRKENIDFSILCNNECYLRHEKMIKSEDLDAHCVSEAVWNVTNSKTTLSYTVQQHLQEKCCELVCGKCLVCIHCFSCTCTDYFISNAICEHIHYICTYFRCTVIDQNEKVKVGTDDEEIQNEVIDFNEEIIIQVEDQENSNFENLTTLQNQVALKAIELSKNIYNIQCENTLAVILESISNLNDIAARGENIDHPVLEDSGEGVNESILIDHCYS